MSGPQTFVKGYPYKYELLNFPPYRGQPPQECINLAEYRGEPKFLERCAEIESKVLPAVMSVSQASSEVFLKREKRQDGYHDVYKKQYELEDGNVKDMVAPGWAAGSASKWCTFAYVFQDLSSAIDLYDSQYMFRKLIYMDMPVDGISEKVKVGSRYIYGSVKLSDHILYNFQDERNLDFEKQNTVTTYPTNRTMLPANVQFPPFIAPVGPGLRKVYFFQRQYTEYPADYWRNCGVGLFCQKVFSPNNTPIQNGVSDPLAGTTDTNPSNPSGAISSYGAFYSELYSEQATLPAAGTWIYVVEYDEPFALEILTCDGRQRKNYFKNGTNYIYRLRNRYMEVPFIFEFNLNLNDQVNNLVDMPCLPVYNGIPITNPPSTTPTIGPEGIALQRLFIATYGGQFKKFQPENTCGGPTTHGVCRWLNEPVPRPVDPMGQPLLQNNMEPNIPQETACAEGESPSCVTDGNVAGGCKTCPAPIYSFVQQELSKVPQVEFPKNQQVGYGTQHNPNLTRKLIDNQFCLPKNGVPQVKRNNKCVPDPEFNL